MTTSYRSAESWQKSNPRFERIDFDRALGDPSYGNVVFDVLLSSVDLPETKDFIEYNKDKLKKVYDIVFKWRPTGEPVLLPDGNVTTGIKFAGQNAFDLLKMAKLLEINISEEDRVELMDIINRDYFLNEKFKKEAESL